MKTTIRALALLPLALALSAQAHDPNEPMKDAEPPNCSAMKDMDHSRMDRDDPVMQAMMKQCSKGMHHDHSDEGKSHDSHSSKNDKGDSKHSH